MLLVMGLVAGRIEHVNRAAGETSAATRLRVAIDARAQAEIDEAVAIADYAAESEWPMGAEIEVVGQRPARLGADGTPLLDEFVALELAALKGVSVAAATWLIRDIVNLRFRHPRLWGRLRAGAIPVFRACQLAAEIARFDLTASQLESLDEQVAQAAAGLSWRRLVNLCRGLIADLVPEQIEQHAKLARADRYVRTLPTDDPTVGYLSARLDTADAVFFDAMIDRIADLLGTHGDTDPKDIRRAKSVGILATPARATLLLAEAAGHTQATETEPRRDTLTNQPAVSAAGCPQPDPPGPELLFVLDGWPDQPTGHAGHLPDDAATAPWDRLPGAPRPAACRLGTESRHTSGAGTASPRVRNTASASPIRFTDPDETRTDRGSAVAPGADPAESPADNSSRGPTSDDPERTSTVEHLFTTTDPTQDRAPFPSGTHLAGTPADDPVAQVWHAATAALPTIRWTDPKLLPTSTLYLHIAEDTLMSGKGPVRAEQIGPLTTSLLALLVGHTRITVKPVIRPYDTIAVDAYEIPNRIRDQVVLRNHIEIFPYSSRPARNQQLDHTIAYRKGEPGQTRAANLGPLSTKAHRAKTHGHWNLTQPAPGVYWWKTPAGNHYRTTPNGTLRLRNDTTLDRALTDSLRKYDERTGQQPPEPPEPGDSASQCEV